MGKQIVEDVEQTILVLAIPTGCLQSFQYYRQREVANTDIICSYNCAY